jgi:hypothetical protein
LRRGAASSQTAIAASTVPKAMKRTNGSFDMMTSMFNNSLE